MSIPSATLADESKNKVPDPTPLWWNIRHRIVSLSFLVGLFRRLRESLSDNFISMSTLKAYLKPQSDGRDLFFNDVIKYANDFLETNKSIFNIWQGQAEALPGNFSYSGQSAQKLKSKNSTVAGRLAKLAENEIYQFFKILLDPHVVARGEASNLHLY